MVMTLQCTQILSDSALYLKLMQYVNYTAIKRDLDMKDGVRKGEENIHTGHMHIHLTEVRCRMHTHITCI